MFGALRVEAQTFEVKRYLLTDQQVLDEQEVTEILAPFTGAHSGLEGLNAAKDALEKALSERGYPFLRAVLPNQTLKNGVVRFELVSFVLSSKKWRPPSSAGAAPVV